MSSIAEGSRPVAMVIGAARGIGQSVAIRLAKEGFDLGITARQLPTDTDAAARRSGSRVVSVLADLRSAQLAEDAVNTVAAEFGRLDVLVHNAGWTLTKSLQDTTLRELNDIMAINFVAAYIASRTAVPYLTESPVSSIVYVSSVHGSQGAPGHSAYGATKGALNALTRQLAVELATDGIRVNAVAPGLIEVDRVRRADWYRKGGHWNPLGRSGTTDEVAELVAFLATTKASFVTGQIINIDGGLSTEMSITLGGQVDNSTPTETGAS